MNVKKVKNKLNIYKEFWSMANKAERIAQNNNYDVDMLISAWQHQLTETEFFYCKLTKDKDPNDTYFRLKREPKEHQLIYVELGRGYSKELYDAHWCYLLKHCKTKYFVIPVTSIKSNSSTPDGLFEMDIVEESKMIGRLHFDEARCIDKMRVIEKKDYINVETPRMEIEEAFKNFLDSDLIS